MATDPDAPHGYDDDGKPNAPYGLKRDGKPRLSNRGARPGGNAGNPPRRRGARTPSGPTAAISNLTDEQRKGMLLELADSLLVSPLASASQVPWVRRKFGHRADAFAGNAFILSQYAPGIADGAILLSKTKPQFLSWMDKAEENAPYIIMAQSILAAAKAMVMNTVNPDPNLAQAGRSYATIRMQQMAAEVNRRAAEMQADLDEAAFAANAERAAYERAAQNGAGPVIEEPTAEFTRV